MFHRLCFAAALALPMLVAQCGGPSIPTPSPAPVPTPSAVASAAPSVAPTATGIASAPPSTLAIAVAAQVGKRQSKYLSAGEIAFVAQHYGTDSAAQSFFALSNFGTSCKTWPYIEDGVAANAALLHAANPKIRVLEYWGFHGDWNSKCMRAYADPTFIANKAAWFTSAGVLDISQQAVRDWWTTAAVQMISNGNLDGLFIDGLQNGPNDAQAPLKVALFQELRTKLAALGHPVLIIANGDAGSLGANGLAPYIDGVMTEGFDRATAAHSTPPTPAQNLAMLEGSWALSQAHGVSMLKAWPHPYDFSNWPAGWNYGQELAYARLALDFQIACYLVVEDPRYSALFYSAGYETDGLFDVIQNPTADPSTWTVDPDWYTELDFSSSDGFPIDAPTFNAMALTIDRDFVGSHVHVDLGARTFTVSATI